jgi:predicted Zn-dependent protease
MDVTIVRRIGTMLAALVLLLGNACHPLCAQQDGQDQRLEGDILLGAARNAVLRGDLKTALQRFEEFRKQYPDRDDGRREYADALFRAGRTQEAMPQYEWLLKRYPNDPELMRTFVDALLQVGDHPRAKHWLADAMTRFPDRVDFAVSLALLYALDDEMSEAEAVVQKAVVGRSLTSRRVQLDAAALYVQLRRPAAAAPIVQELLKDDPDNAQVLGIAVRYALLANKHDQAIQWAERLDRLYPGNIDLRLELASALYAAGNYSEAGKVFAEIVRKSPKNSIALLGCARVALQDNRIEAADSYLQQIPDDLHARQWNLVVVERDTIAGNYLRATQILTRLLEENPNDLQASFAMADLHRAENEFIKADAQYIAEGANADNSLAGRHYAISLYLQRRYGDAERMCRRVLSLDPTDAKAAMTLARTLLKTGRREDAADCIQNIDTASSDLIPEWEYLADFADISPPPSNRDDSRPIYMATMLFDLAMEDGRRDWAKGILDSALDAEPGNAVLWTRLAEWYASFGTPNRARCAADIYAELLSNEPSNQKWLLGLARANVTMRNYDCAMAIYRRLRAESPDNYLYARETARVVFFVCGSPKGLAEYDSILCNWRGLAEEQRRIAKERLAKSRRYSSPSIAACAYEELLCLEPYEQHIAFELGQVRGLLGTTEDAIAAYDHLLSVNPNHRDGQIAIEGKGLEQCQELLFDHRFVRERGRDGLTSIDRLGEYVGYQFSRDNENEWLAIGYGRLSLAPTQGQGTTGDAATVRYQKQLSVDCGPLLSPYVPMAVFCNCEVQQYDRYVATRPVFEAGLKIQTRDDLLWTVAGTMENVLENGESLQQDIFNGGLRTDLNYKPCNAWESEATYKFQAYSDDNTRHAAEFRNRIQLTPDPRRFSILADAYYWNFAEASVFSPGPDPFLNMLHPYWTPQDYAMGGIGLEWKEWLSWDRFDGAQHAWVAFSVMKRWDNQEANYTVYRGTLDWDVTRRLSGYALAEYDEGSPYHGTWAYGGLAWKF